MTANAGDMHDCGVHTHCTYPTKRTGGAVNIRLAYHDGRCADWCIKAGTVEAWHTHEFDGPLWDACGCPETGTE